MEKRLLKISFGALAVVCVATVLSIVNNRVTLRATNVSSTGFTRLVQNLRLTNDASQPSGLISDETFRAKMQTRLTQAGVGTACKTFQPLQHVSHTTQALLYVVSYSLGESGVRYTALMRVPQGRKNLPYVMYANSGYQPVVDIDEPATLLGPSLDKVVLVVPLFFGDRYRFSTNTGVAYGSKDENNLFAESRLIYGLSRCLQTAPEQFMQASGRPLSETLQRAYSQHGGYRLAVMGSGRGGLLAVQAAAVAGATMLSGKSSIADVAHIDAVVQVNALQGLVSAENRLWLSSLVDGYLNETRYGLVAGVAGFEKSFAAPYRYGSLTDSEMVFEVAKRDANALAPFVNLGLKNFAFPSNAKGARAGALLTLQAKNRGDFTANGSRIFANVLATVEFATTQQTNGMNHYYREFSDEAGEAAINSYQTIFSHSFLSARSQQIDELFIVLSDTTRSSEKFYRWLMRGRAFANLGENQPAQLVQDFLASTVGAK